MNIINDAVDVLVDDVLVHIKVVEEWGFSLGEDVCLFEDDTVGEDNTLEDAHDVCNVNNDVHKLVNDMTEDWVKEGHSHNSSNNMWLLVLMLMGR